MFNHADSEVEFSDDIYEVGEEIEIVRGPLKGLSGELCYAEKGKPMVGVYLNLLGYSYVNVDIKDIQRRTSWLGWTRFEKHFTRSVFLNKHPSVN